MCSVQSCAQVYKYQVGMLTFFHHLYIFGLEFQYLPSIKDNGNLKGWEAKGSEVLFLKVFFFMPQ